MFSMMIVLIASFTMFGCSKKPIEGQVFLTDATGIGQPIGGLQILVIDGKSTDDFMSKRNQEAKQQIAACQDKVNELETDYKSAQLEESNQESPILLESPTNDVRYVEKMKDIDEEGQHAEKLTDAIKYLESVYGEPPDFFAKHYP